jgi:hypothetical protein
MSTWSLEVDKWSWLATAIVGAITWAFSHYGVVNQFLLRNTIRLYVQVPKSSKFKELKNKPLKYIEQAFPRDLKELNDVLQKINGDPNLKYSGVNNDISLIMRCLFDDKVELLVDSMDNLVISKMGVEILIFKFEKSESAESYDRSIFIDLTAYRSTLFQWHYAVIAAISVITFILASSDNLRSMIPK